ncbi:MAG: hypothetical protein A3F84_15640 [Candidatus Handelsmanbacteria bacterium RIFCSPLOWO2_12_FULL_64_10]|uniref:Uncharacterized protein n=1 Tax=Handelsmanbacteria sp. (strain RIFCSPLOWO2_12_FULL_64_10) TaxID=1817868 RepID=A0A1F6C310_HANXR|nr:MAG: hypothetical protein A3F84_15640 [Candidatus Handelsmanbacteria bacterium RIFCSPLOWO2_12_FULL_64_10]
MVSNSSSQVKSVSFNPGDATDKLAIAYAVEQGYQFRLDADGDCEVSKPDGTAYYVVNFLCDCPDAHRRDGGSHAGRCKHAWWVAQLRPCEMCGGTMALGTFKTAFGQIVKRFECPDCGNARDYDLVKQERRERRREAAHATA